MTIIKPILLIGVLMLMRLCLLAPRSTLRDRLILTPLSALVLIAVIDPDVTTWAAHRLGVSRGSDLLFYLGFLLVFFVIGTLRLQVREQQAEITTLVRELGLLWARLDEVGAAATPRDRISGSTDAPVSRASPGRAGGEPPEKAVKGTGGA